MFFNEIIFILVSLYLILIVLLTVALFTLFERKTMGAIQRRQGPDRVGIYGLLQPIADAMKLTGKEVIFPKEVNLFIFSHASLFTLIISLVPWVVMPLSSKGALINLDLGLLFILMSSSLNVYSLLIASYASNNKYALLGGMRAVVQVISYEIGFILSLLPCIIKAQSLNLYTIVLSQEGIWNCFIFFPFLYLYLITGLAETNRAPFDLPEAEGELVAGFNIEYSSMIFALFFLGEYSSMLLISALAVTCFFGGWLLDVSFLTNSIAYGYYPVFFECLIFSFKTILVMFFFIWIRSTVPRVRYDHLVQMCWKILLPLFVIWLVLYIGGIIFTKFFIIKIPFTLIKTAT